MKWDIDKAIRALENADAPDTSVNYVYTDIAFAESHGVKPTAEQRQRNGARLCCLAMGRTHASKIFAYGQTFREAYLKMRAAIKKMNRQDLDYFGVQIPQKSNSYMAARKQHGKRKKK